VLGEHRRDPMEYLFCACMCGRSTFLKEAYDRLKDGGVEAWIGASVRSREDLLTCANLGARLVTTDNPAQTLEHLRALSLHD